ncbi:FaeA/PapI family transcriptional regulator [Enterobacter ludwigii]|uniref:FaeA/PapI family transcriptional regulator n=1 Tax=Enterobacter ludwigii TaxID=299767 RepID=UPI003974CBF3
MKNDEEQALLVVLQSLASQTLRDSWVSTREVADAMDWSIYQARRHLLTLRSAGLILSRQKGKGRHNALEWRVVA